MWIADQWKDYEVLIYKTSAATIEFDKKWLKEDLDDETHLKIKEGTYVTPDLKESIGARNVDRINEETFTRYKENICCSCGSGSEVAR